MWAPFFDLPCEQTAGGPGAAGGTAVSPGGGVTGGGAASSVSGATPGLAAKTTMMAAASVSAAAPMGTPPSALAAPVAQSQRWQQAPVRGGPPAGGELRPGAIIVGARAEGLQVRGLRVQGGVGRCLTNVPIVQDRAYWEVHVVELGAGGPGAARLQAGCCTGAQKGGDILMQELGATPGSFAVHFGSLGQALLRAGDVIGVAYDQAVFPVTINIWHNGSPVPNPSTRGLKGEQWPALFVSGCTVDWALDESHWKQVGSCPVGFSALMASRGLIGDD